MKHLFVPYELAVKLKEKGFDEECLTIYQPNLIHHNKWILSSINSISLFKGGNDVSQNDSHKLDFTGYRNSVGIHFGLISVCAPMYQQVVDWFREKHGLHIYVEGDNYDSRFKFDGYKGLVIKTTWEDVEENIIKYQSNVVDPYYEALTKAIEEALKLI